MDNKPFNAWSSIDLPKTRPKEKDPVCEESNVSLKLSLSLDHNMSTATTTDKGKEEIYYYKEKFEVGESSNYSNNQYKIKEHTMNCGEKISSGANFSSERRDISLELSLSVSASASASASASGDNNIWVSKRKSPTTTDEGKRGRFEVGECSNQYPKEEHNNLMKPKIGGLSLQLNLGSDDTCSTSKKRERMGNNPSTSRNKRNKVDRQEKSKAEAAVVVDVDVSTELRLGRHDPWCIKKQLFGSDLGNMSRLMLASELVESYVFPFWNADQLTKTKQEGLPVSVWDCDTMTEHELVFKQWNKGANVLIKNWVKDFVKRRELKLGDEIGLYWDNCTSRFNFTVLNRAARQ